MADIWTQRRIQELEAEVLELRRMMGRQPLRTVPGGTGTVLEKTTAPPNISTAGAPGDGVKASPWNHTHGIDRNTVRSAGGCAEWSATDKASLPTDAAVNVGDQGRTTGATKRKYWWNGTAWKCFTNMEA